MSATIPLICKKTSVILRISFGHQQKELTLLTFPPFVHLSARSCPSNFNDSQFFVTVFRFFFCAHLGTYTLAMPFFEGRVNIVHCKHASCLRGLYYREISASRSVHIATCAGPFVGVEASASSEEGLPDVKRTPYKRPPSGPSSVHPQGWCHRRRGNVNPPRFPPPIFYLQDAKPHPSLIPE